MEPPKQHLNVDKQADRTHTRVKNRLRNRTKVQARNRLVQSNSSLGVTASVIAILGLSAIIISFIQTSGNNSNDQGFSELSLFPWWGGVLLELLLIAANGYLIAAQTALENLKPVHIRMMRDEDEYEANKLHAQFDQRSTSIASLTIALQSARFGIVIVGLALVPDIFFNTSGHSAPISVLLAETIAIALPLLIINMTIELAPKSFAAMHPAKICKRLRRFIQVVCIIFSVPARAVMALANLLTQRFGLKASFVPSNQAEEEIKTIVETAQESGEIEEEEKEMLHSVFEFSDTVVREIMTPRVDIDALPLESEPEAVVDLIRESGHSRIPLYEDTDDAIVGIVHAKDLFMAMLASSAISLKNLMRQPLFVPENKDLHDLLKEMRQTRSQMAIVQDEFGGTSGLVTIEDIVEEVVGDIIDEYDIEEPSIVAVGSGYLIDAKTHVDDVGHELDVEFETEEFDTIGGYVFGLFGRQPALGESIEDENLRYTVAETDGRRILRLRIDKLQLEIQNSVSESK